ncbi:hypothetical protein I7I50_06881 [Histoplasma capsulatum G186AR]|uniref:Uncharacterized protein n=1 Tax=Ajellomyces capsulatus TaxID=5037 RepID=A0A8H8D2T3_AJECA|nr:hypothetical protein I7I52_10044 [Histoplasma capsulatum]QSS67718.1 hypothetical protein I7I50_06881 [Histoplasma capsulatum G186AR]
MQADKTPISSHEFSASFTYFPTVLLESSTSLARAKIKQLTRPPPAALHKLPTCTFRSPRSLFLFFSTIPSLIIKFYFSAKKKKKRKEKKKENENKKSK